MKKPLLYVLLMISGFTAYTQNKDSLLENIGGRHIITVSPTSWFEKYYGVNYEYIFNKHFSFCGSANYQTVKSQSGIGLEAGIKFYLKKSPEGFYLNAGVKYISGTLYRHYLYVDSDSSSSTRFRESNIFYLNNGSISISKTYMVLGGGFQDTYGRKKQWILDFYAFISQGFTDFQNQYPNYYSTFSDLPSGKQLTRAYRSYYNEAKHSPLTQYLNVRLSLGYRF